jgi:membrane-associated phospholipid phosphatase
MAGADKNSNSGERLEALLTNDDDRSVRWDADVPIISNLFILMDFLRCEVITALAVAAMAGIPQWFYGGIDRAQASAILHLCVAGMLLFAFCFLGVVFVALRNRFYALFVLNEHHIYCEVRRWRGGGMRLGCRPSPVGMSNASPRAFSREIPWDKADSFTNFPSMRTILVKRGVWEIVRLYMPDGETHEKARSFLALRLKERGP